MLFRFIINFIKMSHLSFETNDITKKSWYTNSFKVVSIVPWKIKKRISVMKSPKNINIELEDFTDKEISSLLNSEENKKMDKLLSNIL